MYVNLKCFQNVDTNAKCYCKNVTNWKLCMITARIDIITKKKSFLTVLSYYIR